MTFSVLHSLYLAASHVTGPVFARSQRRALAAGKEDAARVGERQGITDQARPQGRLVWFHAASVGETQSILPLISALLDARDDVGVLVTSTTLTSAQALEGELPDRAIHQVAPYDTVKASRAFLDHWQPDLAIWVESELWPRMLHEVGARGVPRLLLNARVSERTAKRWTKFPRTALAILSAFDDIHVQEDATLRALTAVGVTGQLTGSLKQDRPELPCDDVDLANLRRDIGARAVWCAASTHAGEDDIALAAHQTLSGLLILVPRHAERATAIAQASRAMGFDTAIRSAGDPITDTTQVYIADTMGELGLWYRLCPISLIGGSLGPHGGHNPYEPALLGSGVLHGPHVENFGQVYSDLHGANAALEVSSAEDIATAITTLRQSGLTEMTSAARDVATAGQGATQAALALIQAHLPK